MKILVVEDDDLIATGLHLALSRLGHAVDRSSNGMDAQQLLSDQTYHLAILDLGLPGKEGLDVLRDVRKVNSAISVLILSARDDIKSRVKGLDLGADDYLIKPFELDELLARVRVIERRHKTGESAVLELGRLALNLDSVVATWDGQPIELPKSEWTLLRMLAEHPTRVYTRSQIQDVLYGWSEAGESNAVDVHVHHLRKKISPDLIKTVRGIGYRLGDLN
ncbi:MAG: response regulator transcription factor [Burkholderiaceae bacterium]|nr:response regulator transcription factor [Oxalobacteraceae bacterium]